MIKENESLIEFKESNPDEDIEILMKDRTKTSLKLSTLGSYKMYSNENLEKLIKDKKFDKKYFRKLKTNIDKGQIGKFYKKLVNLMLSIYPEKMKKELNIAKSFIIY